MTRKSVIARDVKRQKTVERYAVKRAALKEAFLNPENSYEEKTKTAPDPFARPVKSTSTEEIQSSEVEEDGK